MRKREALKMLSKTDLLKWINDGLAENQVICSSVETLGTGTIYCQLINHYYPNAIPETAVIRQPKNDYEYLSNLRHFQSALSKLKAHKEIDIAKLAKCKYQDNWEMASWLYRYFNEQVNEHVERPSHSTEKRSHQTLCLQKENFLQYRSQTNLQRGLPVGKSSVSSELFQSNFIVVIERAKEILTRPYDDYEKVKQLRLLLNVPMKEDNLSQISDLFGFQKSDSHGVN